MKFSERYWFYRQHGLDLAGNIFRGYLTPELVLALARLHDTLVVNEVMECPPIRITLEVPSELEPDFRKAIGGV